VREATTETMRTIRFGDSVIRISRAQHPAASDGLTRWLGFAGEPGLTPEGGRSMVLTCPRRRVQREGSFSGY